jgi:hypothetical protein
MNAQPNLSGLPRAGYVVAGVLLVGWGLFYADPGSGRLIASIVGVIVLIEGLIGYCAARAMLGLGGKKPGEQAHR